MKQTAFALTGIFVALFFLFSPAVEASLIPGHIYLAKQVMLKLPPWLRDVVEKNQNAYYLGALGHDIADWASYYVGSDAGALLHEVETGRLIVQMLRVYRDKYEFVRKLFKRFCKVPADCYIDTNRLTEAKVFRKVFKEINSIEEMILDEQKR